LYRDITIEDIRQGLQTFMPGESLTPGRLNFSILNKSLF
jgi:hypothetical protein